DAPPGHKRAVLAALLLVLVGGTAGLWAWWKYHQAPSFTLVSLPPQTLRAGQEQDITFQVERRKLDGRIKLTFTAPPGVTLDDVAILPGESKVEVRAVVAADAPAGEGTIAVRASAGALEREATVPVVIAPALFLPPGFKPVGDAVVKDAAGREFYRE